MSDRPVTGSDASSLPTLVRVAHAGAAAHGFTRSCTDSAGRVLRLLASLSQGPIGEIGGGVGVGSAWLLSGRPPGWRYITVEYDEATASVLRQTLAGQDGVEIIVGDWTALLARGPFGLLFIDAAPAKTVGPDVLLSAMLPGGVMVLDDLTPAEHQGSAQWGKPDPIRDAWLGNPGLIAAEIRDSATSAMILAVHRTDG